MTWRRTTVDGTRHRRTHRARLALTAATGAALGLAGCDLGAPPVTYAAPGPIVGVGDVDGDGDLDVVTSGAGSTAFALLVNDGSGAFDSPVSVPHGLCPTESGTVCNAYPRALADIDGDGVADVVVDSTGPYGQAALLGGRGSGPGSFGPPVPLEADGYPYVSSAVHLDVDGDGIADRVTLTDPLRGVPLDVRVEVGDGAGGFAPAIVSGVPATRPLASFSSGDLDEDGHLDLVLDGVCLGAGSGTDDGFLRGCVDVLLGDGAGGFVPGARRAVPDLAVDALDAAVGDVDGDGHLDVVAGTTGLADDGGGPVGAIEVLRGDGAGGLAEPRSVPAPEQTTSVGLADFDGDGRLDVLAHVVGSGEFERILFGHGDGGFGDAHLVPDGAVGIADLDRDGRPDLLRPAEGGVAVYLNRWEGRPD